ncbi:MAG: PH domain-containing protein [Deltaproteobacteria bacterium]|nr:PH domain-containing protein [Deltaproteobacteria bacterium]
MSVDKQTVARQLTALGDFHRFFTSREISCLHHVLTEGEVVHAVTSGFFDGHTWIIVVSNIRILFLDKGMLYGLKQVDMPLNKISSISQKTGFFFGEIEVATSSGSKKISSIPKRNVIKVASILAGLIHGGMAKSLTAREPANDLATQIEKLDNLRQKGALTDDEFRLSKARLLGN